MKPKIGRILLISVATLLSLSLLLAAVWFLRFDISGNERYFQGEAQVYFEELKESGFPDDYAAALTELHLLHPNWNFVPLEITKQNSTYTWNYVIAQETKNPKTNLIPKSNTYAAYHHPTNTELYDSGYYQASIDTVEYFMDPRNFLNETDIFQFFDLASHTSAEIGEVKAVLEGTFMEDVILENGLSYADYFLRIGNELGIQPIYLAAKVRQEQGTNGTSPTLSGKCGTLLADYYVNQTQYSDSGKQVLPPATGYNEADLRALDGLYNAFNVNAGGTGLFSIYYNAMTRAVTGSPEKSADWDGSPSWNTRWKSLWGGSYLLKTKYIDRHQSTVYLQKFNVDPRASDRNFWGQYMQNVAGALTESRSLYSAFASVGALDSTCVFLIPVYGGMPEKISKDPANGSCKLLSTASDRFTYEITQTSPTPVIAKDFPLYQNVSVEHGDDLKISLAVDHEYGVKRLEYSLDGSAWTATENTKKLELHIPMNLSPDSVHILTVRGIADYDNNDAAKKHNYAFLCAVYYVTVLPEEHTLTVVQGEQSTNTVYADGAAVKLPECPLPDFVGWLGSDGSFLPAGATVVMQSDLTYTAQTLAFHKLSGAALSLGKVPVSLRFSAVLEKDTYQILSDKDLLRICARINADGKTSEVSVAQLTPGETYVKCDADTPGITDIGKEYSADFYVELLYTDGSERVLFATGEECKRSASFVANAALNDNNVAYSEQTILFLQSLLSPQP